MRPGPLLQSQTGAAVRSCAEGLGYRRSPRNLDTPGNLSPLLPKLKENWGAASLKCLPRTPGGWSAGWPDKPLQLLPGAQRFLPTQPCAHFTDLETEAKGTAWSQAICSCFLGVRTTWQDRSRPFFVPHWLLTPGQSLALSLGLSFPSCPTGLRPQNVSPDTFLSRNLARYSWGSVAVIPILQGQNRVQRGSQPPSEYCGFRCQGATYLPASLIAADH